LENQSEDAFDVASECDQGAVRNDRSVDNSTAAEGRFYEGRMVAVCVLVLATSAMGRPRLFILYRGVQTQEDLVAPRSGLERYPLTSGLALSPITY
jgi:hypothetical protein